MHDLFDILGLPTNAAARDVRRACARRPRRTHPDFQDAGSIGAEAGLGSLQSTRPHGDDVAIDFVDASALTDSIQASFFRSDKE